MSSINSQLPGNYNFGTSVEDLVMETPPVNNQPAPVVQVSLQVNRPFQQVPVPVPVLVGLPLFASSEERGQSENTYSRIDRIFSAQERERGQIFTAMVENSDYTDEELVENVSEVFNRGPVNRQVMMSGLQEAFITGSTNTQVEIMEEMNLTPDERRELIEEATSENLYFTDTHTLRCLLDDGPIPTSTHKELFDLTCETDPWGRTSEDLSEIVTALLQHGEPISEADIDKAVMAYVTLDEPECLRAVLENCDVSMDTLKRASDLANKTQKLAIATILKDAS